LRGANPQLPPTAVPLERAREQDLAGRFQRFIGICVRPGDLLAALRARFQRSGRAVPASRRARSELGGHAQGAGGVSETGSAGSGEGLLATGASTPAARPPSGSSQVSR
jgi:hypothetical protein